MLIQESKLNIERATVVAAETAILQLLNWKIPNFSVRHFLEVHLCHGFSTTNDQVYSFQDENDKKNVCLKLQEH